MGVKVRGVVIRVRMSRPAGLLSGRASGPRPSGDGRPEFDEGVGEVVRPRPGLVQP